VFADVQFADTVSVGSQLVLRDPFFNLIGLLTVTSKYTPDKEKEARLAYGTTDVTHPAVSYLMTQAGAVNLGGTIEGVRLPQHFDFNEIRLTPQQLRDRMTELKWSRFIAFQTRNPMHRAHIELTRVAANEVCCTDGGVTHAAASRALVALPSLGRRCCRHVRRGPTRCHPRCGDDALTLPPVACCVLAEQLGRADPSGGGHDEAWRRRVRGAGAVLPGHRQLRLVLQEGRRAAVAAAHRDAHGGPARGPVARRHQKELRRVALHCGPRPRWLQERHHWQGLLRYEGQHLVAPCVVVSCAVMCCRVLSCVDGSTLRLHAGTYDAQELVNKYKDEIGIEILQFKEMAYVPALDRYVPEDEITKDMKTLSISGTKFRKMMNAGEPIPEWFSHPDVIKILRVRV
jgi:hypothetical protein